MEKTFFRILLLILISAPSLTGCDTRLKRDKPEPVLARVGDASLKESDISGIYTDTVSAEDSLKLLESHVRSWVLRQLKIQEAEKVLKSSGLDIESMVDDYRNSLLTQRLNQYYIDKYLDTLVPQSQVQEYYSHHKAEFVLDRVIVKGRIVRVPVSYRQQAKLKELMASSNAAHRQDFLDISSKNNFQLTEFDSWTDLREVLAYLPVIRGQNYDNIASGRKVQEMADAEHKYYILITDSRKKGDGAPLEWVEHIIRRIIHNQRSNEIVRRSEDSLYNAALGNGRAEINNKIINNQ